MPIDPRNYPNDSGGMAQYLTDMQKVPRYNEQTKDMQDMILDQAKKRWSEVHKEIADRRDALRSMYQAEYLGGAPTEGAYDWWGQNVAKRVQRGTEAAVTTLFHGPTAGQEAWQRPDLYPGMRKVTKAIPFFGADTASEEIFGAMILGLGPAAGALGLGVGEAATWGGVAARGLGQVGLGATLGAGAYAPEYLAHGDPSVFTKGAVGGALAGAANVPAELGAQAILAKSYESGVGRSLDLVMPNIAKDIKTVDQIGAASYPTVPHPQYGSVSPWEAEALDKASTSRANVISKVGGQTVNLTLTPEETVALNQSGLQLPGMPRGTTAASTVEEWVNFLTRVRDKGWDAYGGLLEKNGAGQGMRAMYRRWMDDVIGPAVDNMMRTQAGRYTSDAGNWMMDEYNVMSTRTYSKLFQEAMSGGGGIKPSILQKLVTDPDPSKGFLRDIVENGMPFKTSAGDNPGMTFVRSVMRGANAWAKRDVEAQARIFTSIRPGFLFGKAFGGPLAGVMGGLRLGVNPVMPYRAGQVALSSALGKITLPMAARMGVNVLYQAMLHFLEPDESAVAGAAR